MASALPAGYFKRPRLTAERFVPDAFGEILGGRLYRTGDRVRWSEDGQLQYIGRVDEQFKLRGFRIEPGEIESAILSISGVTQCAVVLREDGEGQVCLAAFLVGAPQPEEHLSRTLRDYLPEHMIPTSYSWIEALPLTPNGKLDRSALRLTALEGSRSRTHRPLSPNEELGGFYLGCAAEQERNLRR